MDYFARTTGGLELLSAAELERLGAHTQPPGHRRIDFGYAGQPQALLGLRSVDDVYVQVARVTELDHTRASLARLRSAIAALDFAPAIAACASIRPIQQPYRFRVTSSHLGRRNYSRYDIEAVFADELGEQPGWHYVPNLDQSDEPYDLDIRVLLEGDWALIGLRLGEQPLHRRDYKQASIPGSLKAPVAFALSWLAALQPGEVVLDPTCGAGTILIESQLARQRGLAIGGDWDPAALAAASDNIRQAQLALIARPDQADFATAAGIALYRGDAQQAHVPPGSVDAVISNLPWDAQVETGAAAPVAYALIIQQIARALRPGGRAVLLSTQQAALDAALAQVPALRQRSTTTLSLFGAHPHIYVLEYQPD